MYIVITLIKRLEDKKIKKDQDVCIRISLDGWENIPEYSFYKNTVLSVQHEDKKEAVGNRSMTSLFLL